MSSRPFVVQVGALRRNPGTRRSESRAGPIPDLSVSGSAVPAGARVLVDVVLESVHGGVLASGTISAPWSGPCRRCLEPTRSELNLQVRELFEEEALVGDAEETYPLHGDQLDLEPMVRDAVVLGLPLAPLCSEACLGLCPSCGANRNVEPCGCDSTSPDPRWASLDGLAGGRGEAGRGDPEGQAQQTRAHD